MELGQYWLRLWLDAWQHQAITWTNHGWFLISEVLWHSPESNFTVNIEAVILYNKFENYIFEITITSSVWNSVKKVVGPHALNLKS